MLDHGVGLLLGLVLNRRGGLPPGKGLAHPATAQGRGGAGPARRGAPLRDGQLQLSRRDLFKVVLVLKGTNELHYATRSYVVDRPALVFTNRLIPYAWEVHEGFTEQGFLSCW